MPSNLRTLRDLRMPELFSIVGAMLAREGTKVLIIDKEEAVSPTLLSNHLFRPYHGENRLQFFRGGLTALNSLLDPDMFMSGPAFELPTATEVIWMKDIFKKMLDN